VAACHCNHSSLQFCRQSIKAESRWVFQEINEPQRSVKKHDMHLMRIFFLLIKIVRTNYPLDVIPGYHAPNISMVVALQRTKVQ